MDKKDESNVVGIPAQPLSSLNEAINKLYFYPGNTNTGSLPSEELVAKRQAEARKETREPVFTYAELAERLRDPEYAVDYLVAVADFGSTELLAAARMIVRANGGTVKP